MELDLIGQDLSSLREVNWERAVRYESINLHFNRLTNLRGLPSLANISELNLSSNHFKSCALPELTALVTLVTLDLSGNKISSLRNLPHLPSLRNLSVAFNFITSLEYIQVAVPYLEQLDVRGNQIGKSVDLDPLGELPQLRVLFIGGPQQNPVCSRIPNMTRLFQICESLRLIDEKTISEWRNIQLLDAPTPRFDELLKSRNNSGTNGTNSVNNQRQLLANHHPSSSNVLFPQGESSKGRRSPRFFDFDGNDYPSSPEMDTGYSAAQQPHIDRRNSHKKPQPRSDKKSKPPQTRYANENEDYGDEDLYNNYQDTARNKSYSYDDSVDYRSRPSPLPPQRRDSNTSALTSNTGGGGGGIRTNPWSAGSYSDSESHPTENYVPVERRRGNKTAQEIDHTPFVMNNNIPAQSGMQTKSPSPKKVGLTIQVHDDEESNPDTARVNARTTAERPLRTYSSHSDGDRTNISSPDKTYNSNDVNFQKEEHQLSLRLVSTLMTLTALNEKQAFALKVHAFTTLKTHGIQRKQERLVQEKDNEIERLKSEQVRLEQEHRAAKLNYEQLLLDEKSRFDALSFEHRQQELFLKDARRTVEQLQLEKEDSDTEKRSILQEVVETKEKLEDANLRVLQLQMKDTQHHQELQGKEQEIQRLQESLKQMEEQHKNYQQELQYCQHRIQVQDEAAMNYKTSVQVLDETIRAKDDALLLKAHEQEVLKNKLHQLEQELSHDAQEREQSLFVLRNDVVELTEKNKALQRQVDEFESRRLESRLMTLQAAFDEISQHNLELQKEILDKNVQHAKDRKVMKELSRCIKKLQEIDAYRKHLPCEDCAGLQATVEEREGQIDRLRHDLVQLQHDYQQLRLHDHTQTQQHQQQVAMEAQKQLMMEQLVKLESSMHDIDVTKKDMEMQLQVKDVMLHDQRLQIDDLRRRLHDFENAERDWQDAREEYETKLEEFRRDIIAMEEEVEVKTQIAQKVKSIIRDYLRQELKRQQSSDHNGDDGDDDDMARKDSRWSKQRLSRSIELLSSNEISKAKSKKNRSRGQEEAQDDDDDQRDHRTWTSEEDREKQWALKRLRNAVQHAQGFGSQSQESQAMDDSEFLNLLEDIDGIALAKFHDVDNNSKPNNMHASPGKPPRPQLSPSQSNRYQQNRDYNAGFEDEEDDNRDEEDDANYSSKHLRNNKNNTLSTGECQNIVCQQQRKALENNLEEAYRRLSQQKIEFEVQLAKKNEDYQRVSESLTRLEEKSQDLAKIIASEKERYEVSVEKFRLDKKKLSKACRSLEEELRKKNEELQETKSATVELQQAFASFQKLQLKNSSSSTPLK